MVWAHPTGTAERNGQWIRYGLIGSADIIGVARGGTFISIEVKTGKGVQSEQQIKYELAVNRMGGRYFVARSVFDALRFCFMVAAPASVESLVVSPATILLPQFASDNTSD